MTDADLNINRKHNVKMTLMTYAWLNHFSMSFPFSQSSHGSLYVRYFRITAIYAMATPPLPALKVVNKVSMVGQHAHPCMTVLA